eukprot:scaffold2312_cov165-Ochromonas_danica.AAC.37
MGLYFLVKEEAKCFTFEQPKDTPMFFTYKIDSKRDVLFDLYYGAQPKAELQIIHKSLSESTGHIDFTADNDGVYSYCLSTADRIKEVAPVKFSVTLTYGFDSEHYKKLIQSHNFDAVNLLVHKLNDVLTLTLNEADYQKHKEVDYHKDTEKMNMGALWWPVVQITILILAGIYQVHHLKNFFKSNKFI